VAEARKRFQFSLSALIVVVVLVGAYLGVLIRSSIIEPRIWRERALRAGSGNNLKQIGCALSIYEAGSDGFPHDPLIAKLMLQPGHHFPDDPMVLFPTIISDPLVFRNPRFPKEDIGYVYISGSTSATPLNVTAYENVPVDRAAEGCNVLLASGSVEWTEGNQLEMEIKKTEDAIRAAGGNPKRIPISRAELEKRQEK
jgi:hypothetical protein